MNSCCFEIHHSSSIWKKSDEFQNSENMSFNLSNIGEFFLELVSKGMYVNLK